MCLVIQCMGKLATIRYVSAELNSVGNANVVLQSGAIHSSCIPDGKLFFYITDTMFACWWLGRLNSSHLFPHLKQVLV